MYTFIYENTIYGFGYSKPECLADAMNWLSEWGHEEIAERLNNFEMLENIFFISKEEKKLYDKITEYQKKNNINEKVEFHVNYGIVNIEDYYTKEFLQELKEH